MSINQSARFHSDSSWDFLSTSQFSFKKPPFFLSYMYDPCVTLISSISGFGANTTIVARPRPGKNLWNFELML